MRLIILIISVVLTLGFCISCSGETPVTSGNADIHTNATAGGTYCEGIWQVAIDSTTGDVGIISMRSADKILNATQFLEPPVHTKLTIDFDTLQIKPAQKYIGVDVILTHPLASSKFYGFDVRGLVFGPEVTNADGLTQVLSPEFFSGVPFGYKDGLLGTPDSVAGYSGLAGYKYFCNGLSAGQTLNKFYSSDSALLLRGAFLPQGQLTRHYDLSWTDTSPPVDYFVFNYAVYANYAFPAGAPPYSLDSFDINKANSAEAFCMSITEANNNMWYANGQGGGNISLMVEVWDWQSNIGYVSVEVPGVIGKQMGTPLGQGSTSKSYDYSFDYLQATPTNAGDLDILITAVDTSSFGDNWFGGLLPESNPLYFQPIYTSWIYTTIVADTPPACTNMSPLETYEGFVKQGAPWKFLLPDKVGVTCTRDTSKDIFVVSAALNDYPVTFWTFGAAKADSIDPVAGNVYYSSPFSLVGDIACDTKNRVYLVSEYYPASLQMTIFDGASFTEPAPQKAFSGDIYRLTVDDKDNPIVLVEVEPGVEYEIQHRIDGQWVQIPIAPEIVAAMISDFDYNPVQGHYVFVCGKVTPKLFVMDANGDIVFSDPLLFGISFVDWVPGIFIDQDDPDCHIVAWGTSDVDISSQRPVSRYSAVDYVIPKVMGVLTASDNGPVRVGGAVAPGMGYMFVAGIDESVGRITLPVGW